MTKIKKLFGYLIYIIAILGLVGIIIYLIVGSILWGWNGLVEQTKIILAMPVPIIGCTVLSLLVFTLAIISKTSIGKKSLNTLKGVISGANQKLDEAKTQLIEVKQEFDTYKELKKQEIQEIKETYEVLLVGVQQQKNELENLVLEIGENINNGKIEKAINNYVDDKKNKANTEISEIVENAKDEARSEYINEINDLRHELEDLKQLVATNKESV